MTQINTEKRYWNGPVRWQFLAPVDKTTGFISIPTCYILLPCYLNRGFRTKSLELGSHPFSAFSFKDEKVTFTFYIQMIDFCFKWTFSLNNSLSVARIHTVLIPATGFRQDRNSSDYRGGEIWDAFLLRYVKRTWTDT